MNGEFKTPMNKLRYDPSRLGATATKRDSLAAELERDPQFSTAKRQQRTQVFNSTISHANLERQLLAAQTSNAELETKLREKELQIERLERDRRYFADREQEEREEKERERATYDEAKVRYAYSRLYLTHKLHSEKQTRRFEHYGRRSQLCAKNTPTCKMPTRLCHGVQARPSTPKRP